MTIPCALDPSFVTFLATPDSGLIQSSMNANKFFAIVIGGVAQWIERPGFYMSFLRGHGLEGRRFKSCRRLHPCQFEFDTTVKVPPLEKQAT